MRPRGTRSISRNLPTAPLLHTVPGGYECSVNPTLSGFKKAEPNLRSKPSRQLVLNCLTVHYGEVRKFELRVLVHLNVSQWCGIRVSSDIGRRRGSA